MKLRYTGVTKKNIPPSLTFQILLGQPSNFSQDIMGAGLWLTPPGRHIPPLYIYNLSNHTHIAIETIPSSLNQTKQIKSKGTNHYIVLEDLTKPLQAACVCDLKIGRRGHDEQASTKKVIQQKALCAVTTSSSLGFRMCGMRVRASPPMW